jgi:hypothetical protein
MIRPECSGKQMERHSYDPAQAAMLFIDDHHPAPSSDSRYVEFEGHDDEVGTKPEPQVLRSHVTDSAGQHPGHDVIDCPP